MSFYRIVELSGMTLSEESSMFYDIQIKAAVLKKEQPQSSSFEKVEEIKPEIEIEENYVITKHLREIKHFLKFLMNQLKLIEMKDGDEHLHGNKKYLVNMFQKETTKFLMEIHKNEHAKAKANLNDMKDGLTHAIVLLNGFNQTRLWYDDVTLNFFEISLFNFQKQGSWTNVLKQGFVMKQAGGRKATNKCCSGLTPTRYQRKWFILTSQFLCYVELPFPKIAGMHSHIHHLHHHDNNQSMHDIRQLPRALAGPSSNAHKSTQEKRKEKKRPSFLQSQSHLGSTIMLSPEDEAQLSLKEVMLIDHLWEVETKHSLHQQKIKITTSNRKISMRFINKELQSWRYTIEKAMDQSPLSAKLDRFVETSFAPLRKENKVRIMIDGQMYFRNVAEAIKKAESEIFITDWWMVAKYYLERPVKMTDPEDEQPSRLDLLLLAAADRGVKINILHWKESRFAVLFNSLITKNYLMSLHPNIKFIRHSYGQIQLWSHHAKMVVIDQQIAFVGGLDICFGRWDMRSHPLFDIGLSDQEPCLWPGKDFCNERSCAVERPEDIYTDLLDRERDPRMPFHDTAVCIEGDAAHDIAHHFVQLWNNAKFNILGAQNQSVQIITTKNQGSFAASTVDTSDQGIRKETIFNKMLKNFRQRTNSNHVAPMQVNQSERDEEFKAFEKIANASSKYDGHVNFEEEDEKFDERIIADIIQKKRNFSKINMPSQFHTPVQNSSQSKNKKTLFSSQVKQRPRNKKISQLSVISSPRSNKVTPFDEDFSVEFQRTETKQGRSRELTHKLLNFFKVDFFKPDAKKIASIGGGKSQIDENDIQLENKDTKTIENINAYYLNRKINPGNLTVPEQPPLQIQRSMTVHQRKENPIFKNGLSNNMLSKESQDEEKRDIEKSNHRIQDLRLENTVQDPAIPIRLLSHQTFAKKKFAPDIIIEDIIQSPERGIDSNSLSDDEELRNNFISEKLDEMNLESKNDDKYLELDQIVYQNLSIQALRSSSPWSLGLLKVEHSIYDAYIQLIEQSKRYIFIENQFFVTSCAENDRKNNVVRNKVGLALRERILRAYHSGQDFLVHIFIPLMPAFPGDIMDSKSSVLRIQLNHHQKCMTRGNYSLIELLKQDGIADPWHYVRFYSLRQHGVQPKTGLPVTDQVYIHSKCMIVDDTYVVVGSANLNDRSLLGSRDHEIAVVLSQQDPEEMIVSKFSNHKFKVSKFAHKFRTELAMEHFGLEYELVRDPLANRDILQTQAQMNTQTYFEIFKCEPDNSISSFVELQTVRQLRNEEQRDEAAFKLKYEKLKSQIIGHAVIYPSNFLKNEQLGINFLNTEILVPEITFV